MIKNYFKLGLMLSFCLLAQTTFADEMREIRLKAGLCLGCHGIDGHSPNALFPIISGQTSDYLKAQLYNFQSGRRHNSIMEGITKDLKNDDIEKIANYFANKSIKTAGANPLIAEKGKDKVEVCAGCHGQNLTGQALVPRLAGQHADYLSKQLLAFKSGERKAEQMNALAKNLSDEDINVISAYIATIKH